MGSKFIPLPEYINGFRMIECLGHINGSRRAVAECRVCKRIYEVDPNKLKYNKSCGCLKSGRIVNRYRNTHSKLSKLYKDMMSRCYNKKRLCYDNYGGRGIAVCEEWRTDSNVFCEWALVNGYEEGLTIDRIDNDKGYAPDNCRWTTVTEQNRNKRGVKLNMEYAREIRGSSMTINELAKKYGVSRASIEFVKANKMWREDVSTGGAN